MEKAGQTGYRLYRRVKAPKARLLGGRSGADPDERAGGLRRIVGICYAGVPGPLR